MLAVEIYIQVVGQQNFAKGAVVAVLLLLPVLLVAHGIGVFAGSKNATKINQTLLKRIVAVASIAIACIKLFL